MTRQWKCLSETKVYDRLELEARVDILTEEYRKSVKAEVLTLLDISKKGYPPALVREIKFYTDAQNSLGTREQLLSAENQAFVRLLATFDERYHDLKKHMIERQQCQIIWKRAQYLNQVIVPKWRSCAQ